MGRGGFEILDVSRRGEGGWFVKIQTSKNYSELIRSRFQYGSVHI